LENNKGGNVRAKKKEKSLYAKKNTGGGGRKRAEKTESPKIQTENFIKGEPGRKRVKKQLQSGHAKSVGGSGIIQTSI